VFPPSRPTPGSLFVEWRSVSEVRGNSLSLLRDERGSHIFVSVPGKHLLSSFLLIWMCLCVCVCVCVCVLMIKLHRMSYQLISE